MLFMQGNSIGVSILTLKETSCTPLAPALLFHLLFGPRHVFVPHKFRYLLGMSLVNRGMCILLLLIPAR